jgi:carbonic anhydrase/acetyltransferase-like protein (isoleucine patch superfamily)
VPIYALGEHEPKIHQSAYVHPDAVLIGRVLIDEEASIWPGAVLRGDHGLIQVGARTSVQDGTIIHTTPQWPTVIGTECVVGHNAHLEGCVVESRCLIGSGSVTLNRARIGAGAVVGAAALVPEDFDVPAGAMALGVPVKLREGNVDPAWIDFAVKTYVDSARHYRTALRRLDG